MTTKQEIKNWLLEGKRQHATHMLVVCDTFDYEDYPVYVSRHEDVQTKYEQYSGPNMQRVMECYSLRRDIDAQLAEERALHFD